MNSSLFTLGTAQLGMAYGLANKIGKPDATRAFHVLDEAIRQGVRSFDTAAGYGDSEKILGDYFYQNQGVEYEIITKLEPLKLDPQTPRDMAFQKAQSSVELSLDRLKASSLSVLLFHSYNNLIWKDNCLLSYLNTMKEVEKIGVSVYTPEQALQAMAIDGISLIQLPTNLMDHRFLRQRVFDLAEEKHIRIYIRSIYLQGMILMDIEDIPAYLKEAKPFLIQLRTMCDRCNMTLQELAIAFLKAIQNEGQIVIGCETADQVRENARLLKSVSRMSEHLKSEVFDKLSEVPEHIVNPSLWRN